MWNDFQTLFMTCFSEDVRWQTPQARGFGSAEILIGAMALALAAPIAVAVGMYHDVELGHREAFKAVEIGAVQYDETLCNGGEWGCYRVNHAKIDALVTEYEQDGWEDKIEAFVEGKRHDSSVADHITSAAIKIIDQKRTGRRPVDFNLPG